MALVLWPLSLQATYARGEANPNSAVMNSIVWYKRHSSMMAISSREPSELLQLWETMYCSQKSVKRRGRYGFRLLRGGGSLKRIW